MPKSSLSYPKVRKHSDGRYFIDFNLNTVRYRMFSGKRIGSSLSPNTYPAKMRKAKATILADDVYRYLVANDYSFSKKLSDVEVFDNLIRAKLKEPLSESYKTTLKHLSSVLRKELVRKGKLSLQFLNSIPLRYDNNTSYNTTRRHLNVLINYLFDNGFDIPKPSLKTRKQEEVLHKPISDVKALLEQVYAFDKNLYMCCLLTYCCLLRPHQEIRLLKWGDFSDDLSMIHLSGSKVKSKRNRIVPVPVFVREQFIKGVLSDNIFTQREQPYNKDYFKTLFRRFKGVSKGVDGNVTIYSFRHSGAIDIFKRTGSLTKLQKAMGHSSLNVSLTYLRGLEVAELKEEDMPMV
jgi:integrase